VSGERGIKGLLRLLAICGVGVGILASTASSAAAATIHVDTLNEASTMGHCTVGDAITSANMDSAPANTNCTAGSGADVIDFTVTGELDLATGLPHLSSDVTVQGPGASLLDIHDTGAGAGLDVDLNVNAAINDLTISNTNGGLNSILSSGTLAMNRVVIKDHRVGNAFPILITRGDFTLAQSTLTNNSTSKEGVILVGNGVGPSSSAFIDRSTISGNSTTSASGHAGVVVTGFGAAVIRDSTIAGNTGTMSGASGLLWEGGGFSLTNTILAGDGTANPVCGGLAGAFTSLGHNLATDATCNLNQTGDLPSTDPQLGPVQDNGGSTPTQALAATSPAVDHGAAVFSGADQRGFTRPLDLPSIANGPGSDGSDIGAYELQSLLPPDTGGGATQGTQGTTHSSTTCAAKAVTIEGTNGNDKLSGTPGADVINGLGGNDTIKGLAGNDVICGGAGKDKLLGGKGKDLLRGEAGKDTLKGGPGNDKLKGGSGKDVQVQ